MTFEFLKEIVVWLAVYAGVLTAATAGVWIATEAVGKTLPKVENVWIAASLGFLIGITLNGMHLLPLPTELMEGPPPHWFWSYVWAALSGILATFGAKKINDKANPFGKEGPKQRAAVKHSRLPR